MSVLSNSNEDRPRATGHARWPSPRPAGPTTAGWLLGERTDAGDLAELRQRLAEAERRAEDAESALPHLLDLGQRTVNGLLSDARARGRQIIDEAREQAARELEAEREAVVAEASELDALRMAVAAEAMGLEQIRNELEASVAAMQLPSSARASLGLPAATAEGAQPEATLLPPPPSPTELASAGMSDPAGSERSEEKREPSPSSRFADAWAAGEDEMMAEAFDRFFAAEVSSDRLRESVLGSDDTVGDDS